MIYGTNQLLLLNIHTVISADHFLITFKCIIMYRSIVDYSLMRQTTSNQLCF